MFPQLWGCQLRLALCKCLNSSSKLQKSGQGLLSQEAKLLGAIQAKSAIPFSDPPKEEEREWELVSAHLQSNKLEEPLKSST